MRVLLADDHDLICDALKAVIEGIDSTIEVVTAGNFGDAFAIASECGNFSVILLDLNMPGMQGLDGLRKTVAAFPDASVAIITGLVSRSVAHSVMVAGAKGFIPKTLRGKKLVDVLKNLAAGGQYTPEDDLADQAATGGSPACGTETLTAREIEVAALLIKGSSNKEIARALDLQEVTVKLHVRNLCRKLDTKNRTQIAVRLAQVSHFS